ncbi:MAG: glycosyltransferase family 4 protein [Rhodobacteraceae bacterium]|nr:glycosyltransferase family 4 protein [Paracoccaceae bacterium]
MTATILFPIIAGLVSSIAVSVLLVVTARFHGKLSYDTLEGVQKVHVKPTPRVGGIALFIGYFVASGFLQGETRILFVLIGVAGLPAFIFGIIEDLTKKVGVKQRLVATLASGILFSILTGYTIGYVDVIGIDMLLSWSILSFAFTAFAIGGIANAINLIDGFHGLASGTIILVLISFALVAARVDDTVIVSFSLVMAAVMAGFFVVNFPFGKIFLGDAGAYFSGYVVATLAVMLPMRNPEVSPWISILILAYPLTETIVSIVRRLRKKGAHPAEPDGEHLHHVVFRSWSKKVAIVLNLPNAQNAVTSVFMWLLPAMTLIMVTFCSLQLGGAVVYLVFSVLLYLISYHALGRFTSHHSENGREL